jgi:hypothetical protein
MRAMIKVIVRLVWKSDEFENIYEREEGKTRKEEEALL